MESIRTQYVSVFANGLVSFTIDIFTLFIFYINELNLFTTLVAICIAIKTPTLICIYILRNRIFKIDSYIIHNALNFNPQ